LEIRRLNVQGFKAVKSSGWIDLQPLTLIIGRNGSGKSSLVEALQWMQAVYFESLAEFGTRHLGPFSHLLNTQSSDIKIQLEFGLNPDLLSYELVVRKAAGVDRCRVFSETLRKGELSRRATAGKGAGRLPTPSSAKEDPAAQAVAAFIENMAVVRLLAEEEDFLPARLSSLTGAQRLWVQERMARVFPGMGDLKVQKSDRVGSCVVAREKMKGPNGSRNATLPRWMLSKGTLRVATLFASIAARPSLLIVEGIEDGLDPWTLEAVFQELRDASTTGTQVIATTHSPFLLDHVQIDEVIHVKRSNSHSTYRPISRYAEVTKYGDLVAPGTMYISGYFDP